MYRREIKCLTDLKADHLPPVQTTRQQDMEIMELEVINFLAERMSRQMVNGATSVESRRIQPKVVNTGKKTESQKIATEYKWPPSL